MFIHGQKSTIKCNKIFYKEESVPEEVKSYVEPVNTREIVGDVTLQKLNELVYLSFAEHGIEWADPNIQVVTTD